MTIGFKVDTKEVIIEVPLDKEKNFIVLNNLMLLENGDLTYARKMFETINRKKLRQLLFQQYLVLKHAEADTDPHFIPLNKDFIAAKRAKLVDYFDEDELEREELLAIERKKEEEKEGLSVVEEELPVSPRKN